MAHIEPMDIESDFEDKENSIQHSNVLPRTPCTEKGYEELDVSEISMKLRYSITPASSPMSRSFTASCRDNLANDSNKNDYILSSNNLTNSLNSTLTCNDNKLNKTNPLQPISTDLLVDLNGNPLMRRPLDISSIESNVAIVLNDTHADEHLSLPSTSSSSVHTPEATTPTKELPKDEGSPIMRGLKSVFSMFRASQSPIPPSESTSTQLNLSPTNDCPSENYQSDNLISTPVTKSKGASKRTSPLKDSIVFKDDLEKELQWKDESTIIFKDEKIPIHKLFSQQVPVTQFDTTENVDEDKNYNAPVEYMDVSQNESVVCDKTMTDVGIEISTSITGNVNAIESDSEFVDCETTITKCDLDVSDINDIDNVTDTGLSLSSKTESCNALEAYESESVLSTKETVELGIKTNLDTLNTSNISNDSIKVSSQDHNNEKGNESETKAGNNTELTYLHNLQKDMIDTHNYDDKHNIVTQRLPDIVSVPIHDNTNNLVAEKNLDHTINIENFTKEYERKETTMVTDIVNTTAVVNEEINNETFVQNNELNISTEKVGNKSFNITLMKNDAIEYNTIQISQALEAIEFNSHNTANKNTEECSAENSICEEIEPKNYLQVNVDFEKVCNNLGEHEIVDPDVPVTSQILVCQPSKTDSLTLNDVKCDENTQEVDSNIEYKTRDLINKDTMHINNSSGEENELSNTSKVTEVTEKSDKIIINNLDMQLNDLIVKEINNSNNDLPADIPLPNDSEAEQESEKDTENILIETCNINNTTNLEQTDVTLPCETVDITVDKTVDEWCLDSDVQHNVEIEKYVMNKQKANDIIKGEDIDKTFDICSQNDNNLVSGDVLDRVPGKVNITLANNDKPFEKVSDSSLDRHGTLNCSTSQILNNNDTMILENVIKDVVSGNVDQSKPINIINTPYSLKEPVNFNMDCDNIDIDEEIITSAGSSPYVSVTEMVIGSINKEKICDDNVENPFETKTKLTASPPISPKLVNKSYNFNFDEIDDPFATKTKIRVSPTPDSPKQQIMSTVTHNNKVKKKNNIQKRDSEKYKRRSHTERKSSFASKSFNKAYDNNDNKQYLDSNDETHNADFIQKSALEEMDTSSQRINTIPTESLVDSNQQDNCTVIDKTQKNLDNERDSANNTLSLEHITHNDLSTEDVPSLPQDHEDNCDNLIVNKSEISISPSVSELSDNTETVNTLMTPEQSKETDLSECLDVEKAYSSGVNNATCSSKITEENNFTRNINEIQDVGKESSSNVSIATCSSKISDENHTVGEIHTEDEDTIEGPFLESDENFDHINVLNDFASNKDMMQFDMPSTHKSEENFDNGELFIDAETFEFLLNQNKSTVIADSGKESLFLKFDPLYAKRVSSDGVIAALNKFHKIQSTPKNLPIQIHANDDTETTSSVKTDDDVISEESKEETDALTTAKPMMVVNPAMNPVVVPRTKLSTPKLNRHSLTFTSPAIAVIDRLLSLSGNASFMEQNTSLQQSSTDNNTDIAITQLREMLAEKEIHVHNLRSESKELKDRLSSLELQMKNLETESEHRLKKVNDLNERLAEKTKINRSMAVVVEEYERTIASLISEMEQEKKLNSEERMRLVKERDEQTAHLSSMEVSFNDLHSKYEKSKQIILSMKANEDTYKKSIEEFEENLLKMQNNYELLKQHATLKLNHANQELEKFNKAHESEVLKLNAMIKRKEMHITSLEETLAQKTKANEELTAICDELINKVG